jgi:hypothetical protein
VFLSSKFIRIFCLIEDFLELFSSLLDSLGEIEDIDNKVVYVLFFLKKKFF